MARYRKKYSRKSASTSIIKDSVSMAKRLHWRTSLLFGLMSFIVLYFVAPWFLLETVSQTQGKVLQPVIDLNFNRISWLFEKLGIAALVIFWFFAAINFWKGRP